MTRYKFPHRFDGLGLVLARPTRDAVARGILDEVVVVGTSEAPGGSFERGVRTGDVILKVAGVATAGKTLQEVRELGLTGASSTGDEVELRCVSTSRKLGVINKGSGVQGFGV